MCCKSLTLLANRRLVISDVFLAVNKILAPLFLFARRTNCAHQSRISSATPSSVTQFDHSCTQERFCQGTSRVFSASATMATTVDKVSCPKIRALDHLADCVFNRSRILRRRYAIFSRLYHVTSHRVRKSSPCGLGLWRILIEECGNDCVVVDSRPCPGSQVVALLPHETCGLGTTSTRDTADMRTSDVLRGQVHMAHLALLRQRMKSELRRINRDRLKEKMLMFLPQIDVKDSKGDHSPVGTSATILLLLLTRLCAE